MVRSAVRSLYAALILLAAGISGSAVMFALLGVLDVISAIIGVPSQFRGGALVGIVAIPFWLAGALVVGPPLWGFLHAIRLRDRRTALTAGAVAAGLGVPLSFWILGGGGVPSISAATAGSIALLSGVAAISGVAAGETIHSLAYRSGEAVDAR